MKKALLKKSVRKRIKSWKIGDYIRQFSIVTLGVLLTLWLTGRITESSKQREVRQALQLVMLELQDNLQVIREYERLHNEEKRIAQRLQETDFSLSTFPSDTVEVYWISITNGMGKPFRFQTDALEMLKTTGLAAEITDKQIVIDLLRCYNDLKAFDYNIGLYYDQRSKTIVPHRIGARFRSIETDLREEFEVLLADKTVQGWLAAIPRAYDAEYFDRYAKRFETTIVELQTRYR